MFGFVAAISEGGTSYCISCVLVLVCLDSLRPHLKEGHHLAFLDVLVLVCLDSLQPSLKEGHRPAFLDVLVLAFWSK